MSMKEIITKMECKLKDLQDLLVEVSAKIADLEDTTSNEASQEKLEVLMESRNDLLDTISETENMLRLHATKEDIEASLLAVQWEKNIVEEKHTETKEELNTCYEKISELSKSNVVLEDQLHNTEFNLQMDVFETTLNELVNDQQSISLTLCSPSLYSPRSGGTTAQKMLQTIRYNADSGNLDAAINLCTIMIPRLEDAYGKDHIDIGNVLLELYKLYMQKGMIDEAMQSLQNAKRIYEKLYKTDDHDSLFNLVAKLFRGKGNSLNERHELVSISPIIAAKSFSS